MEFNCSRVLVAGIRSGVGVSSITLGLSVALTRKNLSVAVGTVGTSLVPSTHYRRITHHFSHSLDLWSLTLDALKSSLGRLSTGAEIVLLESKIGLFDVIDGALEVQSTFDLAEILEIPIVLVVDAYGCDEGAASIVLGALCMKDNSPIVGVIANKVKDKYHLEKVRNSVSNIERIHFLGGILHDEELSEGVGTNPSNVLNPSLLSRKVLISHGSAIDEGIDTDKIITLAENAKSLSMESSVLQGKKSASVKIAIADDVAFHLTVQDNLDLLSREGARLSHFSPIADSRLPNDVDALYLSGSHLHLYAKDVHLNQSLMQNIIAFIQDGGVVYAEGSSVGYLCYSVRLSNNAEMQMMGLIPATSITKYAMEEVVDYVYCKVLTQCDTVIAPKGTEIRGMRDQRWEIDLEQKVTYSLNSIDRDSKLVNPSNSPPISRIDGFMPTERVFASTIYLHWGCNPELARYFIDFIKK